MTTQRILVVDDEVGMLEVCRDTLGALPDVDIETESRGDRAAVRLLEQAWDLLVADIRMPGLDGLELLTIARQQDPGMPVLVMTAFPTVDTAVESMKRGAADYVIKPFLPDDLRAAARRLLEARRLHEENDLLSRFIERPHAFGDIIGGSAAMRAVFDAIEQVAPTDVDVLVTGETGTGKELVARAIHQRSHRAEAHFVPVDCGAIPEDLLEAEFFGHERGAYTGASARRLGLVEFASGGTLFLDEIDHLPAKLQVKLLRALQERRIRRVGGSDELDVDLRVVAATSADLEREVREQVFRADLYYRINVACVALPPLRERVADIPMLVWHFVARYAREIGRDPVAVDGDAVEVLTRYPWPGNVRELQNVIKRVLVFSRRAQIRVEDLPEELVAAAGSSVPAGQGFFALRERHTNAFEQSYIEQLLRCHRGDVATAAAEAMLPRGTLYRLMKKHGIAGTEYRS